MCAMEVSLINLQIITNYMVLHTKAQALLYSSTKFPVSLSTTFVPMPLLLYLLCVKCGLVFGFSFHSLALSLSLSLSPSILPTLPFSFLFVCVCVCMSWFFSFREPFFCDTWYALVVVLNCGIPWWNVKYAGKFFSSLFFSVWFVYYHH